MASWKSQAELQAKTSLTGKAIIEKQKPWPWAAPDAAPTILFTLEEHIPLARAAALACKHGSWGCLGGELKDVASSSTLGRPIHEPLLACNSLASGAAWWRRFG